MPDIIPTFAFTTKTGGRALQLKNKAFINYNTQKTEVNTLWDTGATGTCISKEIATKLGLIPTGKKFIQTPSGRSQVNTYLINITLPNNVNINDVEVCDSEIGSQGIDMLVGMDIITLGDFALSYMNNTTVFSFRIPPREQIDYVKKLNVEKLIGPKHGKGKGKKKKK